MYVRFALLIVLLAYAQPRFSTAQTPALEVITPDNVDRLELLGTLGRGLIHRIEWSPDGSMLAVATSRGVYIYDAAGWDAPPLELPDYPNGSQAIAWHPEQNWLATVDSWQVRLWEIVDGVASERNVHQVEGREQGVPNYSVNTLYYLPDERIISFVIVDECSGCYWDATNGNYLNPTTEYDPIEGSSEIFDESGFYLNSITPLLEQQYFFKVVCQSPFENFCHTNIDVYNAETSRLASQIETDHYHWDGLFYDRTLAANAKASILADGACARIILSRKHCREFNVELYNLITGNRITHLKETFNKPIVEISITNDSHFTAASDGSLIYIWNTHNGVLQSRLIGYGDYITQLKLHPSRAALFSDHSGSLVVWDLQPPFDSQPVSYIPAGGDFDFRQAGNELIIAKNYRSYDRWYNREITLWNISDLEHPVQNTNWIGSKLLWGDIRSLAVNDTYNLMIFDKPREGQVFLWDFDTSHFLQYFWSGFANFVFSPDGRLVIFQNYDGSPILETSDLLDLSYGATINVSGTENNYLLDEDKAVFSTDSKYFASATFASGVRIWEAATKSLLIEFPPLVNIQGYGRLIESMSFSPDNQLLAIALCESIEDACLEARIQVLDLIHQQSIFEFDGYLGNNSIYSSPISSMVFSPDGKLLLVATYDHIEVWGVPAE